MALAACLVMLPAVTFAFPQPVGDPFSPLGSWHRRGPPCGLPPFTSRLPEEAQSKVRAIWKDYKEGAECEEQHKLTRDIIHELPESVREEIFAGRCGPSFLKNVSGTVRREFKNVWFDHKMNLDAKELALKKLAFSMLSGESLALFNKWDEELQKRKADLAERIEALSPDAKNALEEWRAIRQEERDFLARLPKEIRDELRTLCPCWPRMTTTVAPSTTTEEPSSTTSSAASSSSSTTEATTTTTEVAIETSTISEVAEKEFAHLLDFVLPDELPRDAQCSFFF